MLWKSVAIFLVLIHNCDLCDENILFNLDSFEFLNWSSISFTHYRLPYNLEIDFFAFGRLWQMTLKTETMFLAENFSVTVLGENKSRTLPQDYRNVKRYVGYLSGEYESSIVASIDEYAKQLTAKISTSSGIYFLESLSMYKCYQGNDSLLFYNLESIRDYNRTNIFMYAPENLSNNVKQKFVMRNQRSLDVIQKKLCSLIVVADYTFFNGVGGGDGRLTTHIILASFHRLNALYRSTKFVLGNQEEDGFGFLLQEIIIHDSWNSQPGHYNARTDIDGIKWNAHTLSTALSQTKFPKSCLVHLLTYRPFNEALGRAWTAASEFGGICSPPLSDSDKILYPNTGWTTYMNYNGRRLLNARSELITAHEIGHNWGAVHDPYTDECSPSASSHGKYLMYPYSVAGFAKNNYRFSPCSRRAIGLTLQNRIATCFVESIQFISSGCGNERLDAGEECDVGHLKHHPCCTSTCKLRPGAHCCPINHDCCTETCQVASSTRLCGESSNPCLGFGRCDGISPVCPGPTLLSGVPCAENGECVNGSCQPFCALHGLPTCLCDDPAESCLICCLFSKNKCRPFRLAMNMSQTASIDKSNPEDHYQLSDTLHVLMYLDDHRPCATGHCMRGKCVSSNDTLLFRLWRQTGLPAALTFGYIFKNNLVLIWIFLSLSIYVLVLFSVGKFITFFKRSSNDTSLQPDKLRQSVWDKETNFSIPSGSYQKYNEDNDGWCEVTSSTWQ